MQKSKIGKCLHFLFPITTYPTPTASSTFFLRLYAARERYEGTEKVSHQKECSPQHQAVCDDTLHNQEKI